MSLFSRFVFSDQDEESKEQGQESEESNGLVVTESGDWWWCSLGGEFFNCDVTSNS